MISSRFQRNLKSWEAFCALPKKQQKIYIGHLNFSQIKDAEELFYNILKGNIAVEKPTLQKLRRHKRKCKQLAHRKLALSKKKKILQTGEGLPLLALGMSILPTLIDLIKR